MNQRADIEGLGELPCYSVDNHSLEKQLLASYRATSTESVCLHRVEAEDLTMGYDKIYTAHY